MQKQKFGVTCPDEYLVKSVLVPPEHEKQCFDVLRLGCIAMHYVTRRSHRIEKLKFGLRCPNAIFVKSVPIPPEHEK
jgi:hypothetical protein